jgi:WD40 repeat protein
MVINRILAVGTLALTAATLGGVETWRAGAGAASPPAATAQGQPSDQARVDRYGDPLPAGAIVRLGTVRYRFQCDGFAFLPDGETVVSAKSGGAIQIWNTRTGKLLREIDGGQFQIGQGGFALSRDGQRLALGGSLTDAQKPGWRSAVRVFDVVSGKEVRTFEANPRRGYNSVALTPDGKLLLALAGEGNLGVHELATGTELLQHKFPGDVMAHLALSADGSTLALASGPNTRKVFVWRWQTAEEPREFKPGDHGARHVAFSPDGKLLAGCDDSEVSVRVWEVTSGQLLHKLELPDHEPYRHYDVAFSPDGKTLAANGATNEHGAVHLWDPITGKFLERLPMGGSRLAYSPHGGLLAAGSRVWDLAAGKELSSNDQGHRGQVEHVVTGDQGLVVTAGGDKTIRLWDAATGMQQRRLEQEGWIRALALSPDGTKVVSNCLLDDSVSLWEVATGRRIFQLPGHGRLGGRRAAGFTLDGKSFLSWGDDMYLRKWDLRTGKAVSEHAIRPTGVRVFTEDDDPRERDRAMMLDGVTSGLFTQDGKQLVLQTMTRTFIFDTDSGKERRSFPIDSGMLIGQALAPDGKSLLASAWGKSVQTKLPDGTTQISTPMSHAVTLWELTTGGVRKQLTLPEQGAGPVAFSADGTLFAAASYRPETHLRVWDPLGQEVWAVKGFPGIVRSLAFTPDGKRLVSGMDEGSALVWDLTQKR